MKAGRRWFQFSLRSFLVLVMLACAWLAVVVHRAREQQEAVAAIERAGGLIQFDGWHNEVRLEHEDMRRWSFHLFNSVVEVFLEGDSRINDVCQDLARLPSLRRVIVLGPLSDDGLTQLMTLRRLDTLYLSRTRITNAGVLRLSQMRGLQYVCLGTIPVKDSGLHELSKLENLGTLAISLKDVSSQGLHEFRRALPKCTIKSIP
jgi:hypothetical protein